LRGQLLLFAWIAYQAKHRDITELELNLNQGYV
jgi:hypothetical protein